MASAATRHRKRPGPKARAQAKAAQHNSTGNSRDAKSLNDKPDKPKRQMHANSIAALQKTMWKPGQSGNPLGPQAGARNPAVAAAKLRDIVTDAVDVAREIMQDTSAPASARLSAAHDVLDRVLGKAIQTTVNVTSGGAENVESMSNQALASYVARLLDERGADPGEVARLVASGGADLIDVTPQPVDLPDVVSGADADESADTST
jgi:hypothetical protein